MTAINHSTYIKALKQCNLSNIKEQIIESGSVETANKEGIASQCRKYEYYEVENRVVVYTPLAGYQFHNHCPKKPEPEYTLDCVLLHKDLDGYHPEHVRNSLIWERLAFEEEDGTTIKDKLDQCKNGEFIPLSWVLPVSHTTEYFTTVIHSEDTPFGALFFNEKGDSISPATQFQAVEEIYIKSIDTACILPEIEKWYENS